MILHYWCNFVCDLNLDNVYIHFSGNGSSEGRIIQRFPETDWESCPFTQSIELVTISDFRKTLARPYISDLVCKVIFKVYRKCHIFPAASMSRLHKNIPNT